MISILLLYSSIALSISLCCSLATSKIYDLILISDKYFLYANFFSLKMNVSSKLYSVRKLFFYLITPWHEPVNLLWMLNDINLRHYLQYLFYVIKGTQPISFSCLNQTKYLCTCICSLGRCSKQPVLSTHNEWSYITFIPLVITMFCLSSVL